MRNVFGNLGRIAALAALITAPAAYTEPFADVSLQDLYFRPVTLGSLAGAPATVLFFFSNTCPVARRYMPRISQIEAEYRARGVRCVAVNVSPADTLLDVADHAFSYDVAFPVVKDSDFSVARALQVTRTPEVVLLDAELAVRYQGRIDDQYRLGGARHEVGQRDLVDALDAVLAGKEVSEPRTQAEGCIVTFPIPPLRDDKLTYAEDIQPVFAEHCVSCHRSEGAAPFPLDSQAAIVERKEAISRVILDAQMPPWHASVENSWLTSRQMSYALQHRIRAWLSGPMLPGEGGFVAPEPVTHFDKTFRLDHAEPSVQRSGRTEMKLGPALEAGIWIKALQVQAEQHATFLNATVYYQEPGQNGPRRYLSGPLLNGQRMGWGENAAMFVPPGVVLCLGVRFDASAPDTVEIRLGLETSIHPPEDFIECIATRTTRAQDGQFHAALKIPPGARVHSIVVDYPDYNAAVIADFFPPEAAPRRLLTIPAFDPRWPLPYPVAETLDESGHGGQLKATLSFPHYFTSPGTPPSEDTEFALFATFSSGTDVAASGGASPGQGQGQ